MAIRKGQRQGWVRGLLPRVTAIALCLPVTGGPALASVIDAILYPSGACCCERAHGRPHRCHCAMPHDESDAATVHQESPCAMDSDDGTQDVDTPQMAELLRALLPVTGELRPGYSVRPSTFPPTLALESRPAPQPPTPPPFAAPLI